MSRTRRESLSDPQPAPSSHSPERKNELEVENEALTQTVADLEGRLAALQAVLTGGNLSTLDDFLEVAEVKSAEPLSLP